MDHARRLVALAAVGYLAAVAANRSLVEVRGSSMEPTLWSGDLLLTLPVAWTRLPWRPATGSRIRPGRLVVVADPTVPAGTTPHLVVKRVHSIDGARVEVRGDAPDRSTDSRTWGPLPRAAVRRVVVARWPDVRTRLTRTS